MTIVNLNTQIRIAQRWIQLNIISSKLGRCRQIRKYSNTNMNMNRNTEIKCNFYTAEKIAKVNWSLKILLADWYAHSTRVMASAFLVSEKKADSRKYMMKQWFFDSFISPYLSPESREFGLKSRLSEKISIAHLTMCREICVSSTNDKYMQNTANDSCEGKNWTQKMRFTLINKQTRYI